MANPRRSGSTWTTSAYMSVTSHHHKHVFAAWQHDRSTGLDSIMLAPTRDLVAALNRRARTHRLAASPRHRRRGGAGRQEPRQCRRPDHHPKQRPPTAPDSDRMGQNGDRWTVRAISGNGDLESNTCATGTGYGCRPPTFKPPPSLATQRRCTEPRDSRSTPCTASRPVKSLGSSSTPC